MRVVSACVWGYGTRVTNYETAGADQHVEEESPAGPFPELFFDRSVEY
jgi:hypothetical protein